MTALREVIDNRSLSYNNSASRRDVSLGLLQPLF
jgi:hypothetical protein